MLSSISRSARASWASGSPARYARSRPGRGCSVVDGLAGHQHVHRGAAPLRLVLRRVRRAQELRGPGGLLGPRGNAAGHSLAAHGAEASHGLQGEVPGLLGGAGREQDAELVPAEAPDHSVLVGLGGSHQCICRATQHLVARLVAAAVVHLLEVVDVAEHERRRAGGARRVARLFERHLDRAPAREPGQRVRVGERLDLGEQLGPVDGTDELVRDRAQEDVSSPDASRGWPGAVITSSSPQGSPPSTIGTARLDSLPSRLSRSRSAGSVSGSSIVPSELPPSRMACRIDG